MAGPRNLVFILLLASQLPPSPCPAQVGSPAGPVPPDVLEARRERLLEALGGAPAILTAARQRDLDREYPQDSDFRQDNNFFYLTGIEAPQGWLVLNLPTVGEAVLYLPPVSPRAEQWTGPQLGPGPLAASLTGMARVRSTDELGKDLRDGFDSGPGSGRASRAELFLSLGDPSHAPVLDSLLSPGDVSMQDLGPILAGLRVVKDEEELRRLKRAVEITMEAHREVWRVAEPGLHEYELEAALEYVFRANGAERVGFPPIVGSGPNSVILHYDKNRRALRDGDLVVVDIGAEFGYYTADITRTFPANARFTERQKALYDLVLGAGQAALATLQPGASIRDLQQSARTYFQENSGDLCGEDSCLRYFIHGLSHWLGMDVHDVGAYTTPLAAGMVLTIEPGLYLPDEELGIRIEDDVLVTDTGYELLTRELPRSASEIEAVMNEPARWVRAARGRRIPVP